MSIGAGYPEWSSNGTWASGPIIGQEWMDGNRRLGLRSIHK